jgi:hypothetical protein
MGISKLYDKNNQKLIDIAENEVVLGAVIGIPKSIMRSPHLTFLANFNIDGNLNATWGRDSLIGVGHGENPPTVHDGYLDLKDGWGPVQAQYVDYVGDLNIFGTPAIVQYGAIRFKWTGLIDSGWAQGYTSKVFSMWSGSESDDFNLIQMRIQDGYPIIFMDLVGPGGVLYTVNMGIWNWVQNQTYEIEFNYDCEQHIGKLFIDGVQFGPTLVAISNRDTNIHKIRLGSGRVTEGHSSWFSIDDFKLFNCVMHDNTYTPGGYDDDLIFPDEYSDYIPCIGGNVNNQNSSLHGILIPDMSPVAAMASDEIVFAMKIFD